MIGLFTYPHQACLRLPEARQAAFFFCQTPSVFLNYRFRGFGQNPSFDSLPRNLPASASQPLISLVRRARSASKSRIPARGRPISIPASWFWLCLWQTHLHCQDDRLYGPAAAAAVLICSISCFCSAFADLISRTGFAFNGTFISDRIVLISLIKSITTDKSARPASTSTTVASWPDQHLFC